MFMPEDDRDEIEREIALDDESVGWDVDRAYELGDPDDDEDDDYS